MAVEHNEYLRGLAKARREGFAVTQRTVASMQAQLAAVLERLAGSDLKSHAALAGQLQQVLGMLERAVAASWANGAAVQISTTMEIHREILDKLGSNYELSGLGSKLSGGDEVAWAIQASRLPAKDFRSLARYWRQGIERDVNRILGSAAARGVAAGETARDLARVLADPSITAHLPSRSRLHRGKLGQIDFAKYGLSPTQATDARKALYDARRIAVSETNNALRESNRVALDMGGVVRAAKWQLSGRHPEPDACDALAEANVYGYGPGMYPPEHWPFAPHPHCGCMQAGPVQARRPSEWNTPKPAPPAPRIGSVNREVQRLGGKMTDARKASQIQMARSSIKIGRDPRYAIPKK